MVSITRNDVPGYLRKGEFFQTLDVTDSEEFEVPSDCFKPDLSVECLADVEFLIRSLRFWAVDVLPVEVVLFLITHKYQHLTQLSTNFKELENWWTMIGKLKSLPKRDTIPTAISVSFPLYVIKGLHERGSFPLVPEACIAAASEGVLEILAYLHEQDCPWDEKTTDAAVSLGSMSCLEYAHMNGCALSENCIELAARTGQLDALKYLVGVGEAIQSHSLHHGVLSLKLEIIQYLCEAGCEVHPPMMTFLAQKGSLACLQYLHQRGNAWDSTVCAAAAANGHLPCLQYAHTNGCPWDYMTTYHAAKNNHLKCLKYAHLNGCSTQGSMTAAIQGGSWECYEYTRIHNIISIPVRMFCLLLIVIVVMLCMSLSWVFYLFPGTILCESILNHFGERIAFVFPVSAQQMMRDSFNVVQYVGLLLSAYTAFMYVFF